MTETNIWTRWESHVVNGLFPLRRFLGRSNHSVVFLTEYRANNLANAAIKIIPVDPAVADMQLARWQAAAALSHPHLIRLLDAGRCKLGGHPFLFVVTEYAEQNLAQILPHRALTAHEARELLRPTLDALGFLHAKNLVHGQLKPTNFLVVNDQLKLSSDAIRISGEQTVSVAKLSPYDPPEAQSGAIGLTGDIWSLGATLMEALTQIPPGPHDGAEPQLPSTLPDTFAETVRRCLSRDPAGRPTLAELRAPINAVAPVPKLTVEVALPVEAAPPAAAVQPVAAARPAQMYRPVADVPRRTAAPSKPSAPRWLLPAAAALAVIIALWAGIRALRGHPSTQAPIAVETKAQPSSTLAAQTPAQAAPANPVLHEEIPTASRGARESIHGQIKIVVRVSVDRSGSVTAENLEVRGSSRYFARLAAEAAKKWQFAPADNSAPREWLIQFDFARAGVGAHAVPRGKP